MGTRKQFVAAAAASVSALVAAPAIAQGASLDAAAASPSPAPKPSPKKVSATARAFAEQMRTFDPHLTDKNVADIAAGIDGNLKLGDAVNPKGKALKNWDEPVTVFEVPV